VALGARARLGERGPTVLAPSTVARVTDNEVLFHASSAHAFAALVARDCLRERIPTILAPSTVARVTEHEFLHASIAKPLRTPGFFQAPQALGKVSTQGTALARRRVLATVAKIRSNLVLAFPVANETVAKLAKCVSVVIATTISTERVIAHNTHGYFNVFNDFHALGAPPQVETDFFIISVVILVKAFTRVDAEALVEMTQVVGVYVALLEMQAAQPVLFGTIAHTDRSQEASDCETTHIRAVFELYSLKVLKLGGERSLIETLTAERRHGAAYLQVSHVAAVS
jgi:hypothetical protein